MNVVAVRSVLLLCTHFSSLIPAYHLPPDSLTDRSLRRTNREAAEEPLLLTPLIDAGKLKEARHLSKVVPFIDDIESYAGFLTVNKTSRSHLYFWFIPKTTVDNTSAPVILWLQGGPGWSSLFGLFAENGPYQVTQKGLKRRVHAWTNHYHMLYIDQPVGTGFSFTENNGFISTEEEVAEHLYSALVQFYELFAEFRTHDFYIAGESYAGKYTPALGHKIHTANRQPQPPRGLQVPLKGMTIGNGFSDPENMLEYAVILHEMGLIDRYERRPLEATQDVIKYLIQSGNWSLASSLRAELLDDISKAINLTNLFDYTDDDGVDAVTFAEFVTRNQTRQRIHVGGVRFFANSAHVLRDFHRDIMQTVRPWIEELLEHYPMLFYNGEFDIRDSHQLTENYLDKLHWSGAIKFGLAEKRVWRIDEKVAGYYKTAGNLVYVMVRGAGHMVPANQPKNALNLIDMFVEKKLQLPA